MIKFNPFFSGNSDGYSQDWLKGDEIDESQGGAHPHEGITLAGGDGYVAVGGTLSETTRKVFSFLKALQISRSQLGLRNKRGARSK